MKLIRLFFLIVTCIASLSCCNNDIVGDGEKMNPTPNPVTFSNEGGTAIVKIDAVASINLAYEICDTIFPDSINNMTGIVIGRWFTVQKEDSRKFTVKVSANKTGVQRKAVIGLQNNDRYEGFTIEQEP